MFGTLVSLFDKIDKLALAVGILIGLAIIALMRASQVWKHRGSYGYNAYSADRYRRRLKRVAWFTLVLGVGGVLGWLYLWDGQSTGIFESLTNQEEETASLTGEAAIQNMRLLIPRLAVEEEIVYAPIVGREWDISRLRYEIASLEGTAPPGQTGNAVLAGHVTVPGAGWGPFRELETLQPGDEVFVEQEGGATYTYVVSEMMIVEPNDIQVAYPTSDTRLTLITCAEWDEATEQYAKRIVVIAHMLPTQTGIVSELP